MPDRPLDVLQDALVSGQRPNERGARNQEDAHAQEADDRDDLHHRQPGLDLAVLTGGQQVNAANDDNDDQGDDPLGHAREPADEERGRARHLQARHHDEHDPIQPPDSEPGPPADPGLGVGRERAGRRQRRGQLREGQHHRDDDDGGQQIGHEDGGARLVNGGARAQEEAGTNRQAQGHHGQVPRFERLTRRCGRRRSVCCFGIHTAILTPTPAQSF